MKIQSKVKKKEKKKDSTWKNFVVNRCVCYCLHVFVKELLKVMNNQFFRCYWVQTEKKNI